MHPSTALATVLVDEWVRAGVREVVLCPGSRSAPLAYAVLQAERAGSLRLHVRVDERSAGFLALGLAKVSRRPAVIVTTSGTAVANLHPAVLEAHHACVPLIVVSADRPAELRRTGANQTTVQPGFFAGAVRWEHDLQPAQSLPPGPGDQAGGEWLRELRVEQRSWRSVVCRAWAAAIGHTADPGPVHLNVAFRDPLAPDLADHADETDRWAEALQGRPGGAPWAAVTRDGAEPVAEVAPSLGAEPVAEVAPSLGAEPVAEVAPSLGAEHIVARQSRRLLILGDLPDPADAQRVLDAAGRRGWPVIAEPFGTTDRRGVLPHGPLLLSDEDFVVEHRPDRVLTVGRLTLSREVGALLRHPDVEVEQVTATSTWADPSHVARRVHRLDSWLRSAVAEASTEGSSADAAWAAAWQAAGVELAQRVAEIMGAEEPTGLTVAGAVSRSLRATDTLVLGSSNPARDLDLAACPDEAAGTAAGARTVVGNRGLAGIDGTVSTAVGVALAAAGRTIALMGDLTFLHDSNGLLIGPAEPRPDLSIVVVNDDGGGIFATLAYGEPERAAEFERVFGTPTGTDVAALCQGYGVPHRHIEDIPELMAALAEPATGVRVLEVPVDRARHRALRQRLREAARSGTKGRS